MLVANLNALLHPGHAVQEGTEELHKLSRETSGGEATGPDDEEIVFMSESAWTSVVGQG